MDMLRYFVEGTIDPIAVCAGIVQTGLFADFFYIYFTKWVGHYLAMLVSNYLCFFLFAESFKDRSSNYPHEVQYLSARMYLCPFEKCAVVFPRTILTSRE